MTVCKAKNGRMVRPNCMRLAGEPTSERPPFLSRLLLRSHSDGVATPFLPGKELDAGKTNNDKTPGLASRSTTITETDRRPISVSLQAHCAT